MKTVVGLFQNAHVAECVIRDIESKGFPRMEVRALHAPTDDASAKMSTPHTNFEAQVSRELVRLGASEAETQAYVNGLRRGGMLVLATDSEERRINVALEIMNQHEALEIEETSDPELKSKRNAAVPASLTRRADGAARCFVWCILVDRPVSTLSKSHSTFSPAHDLTGRASIYMAAG